MNKALCLLLSVFLLIALSLSTTGCGRSVIHSRTIYQGDWAVRKKPKTHYKNRIHLRRKPVNSKLFNQPGPLKF